MPRKVLEGWRRQRPRPVATFGRRQAPKKQSQAYISAGRHIFPRGAAIHKGAVFCYTFMVLARQTGRD